jgi:hypothetical protein
MLDESTAARDEKDYRLQSRLTRLATTAQPPCVGQHQRLPSTTDNRSGLALPPELVLKAGWRGKSKRRKCRSPFALSRWDLL